MAYTTIFGGSPVQPSQVSYHALTLDQNITLVWPTAFQDTNNVVARIMDITPTETGFTLQLPSAQEVSPGQDLLIRNATTSEEVTFSLLNGKGDTLIATVQPASLTYLYLTDNTTVEGEWIITPFGASGVSTVTSVGAQSLNPALTVTGSPITGAGTFVFDLSLLNLWNNQTVNTLIGDKILSNSLPGDKLVVNSTPLTKLLSTGYSGFVVGNDADYTYSEINYPTNASQLWYLPTQATQGAAPSLQPLVNIWNAQANNTLPISKLQNQNQFISAAGYLTAASANPVTIIRSMNIASIVYTPSPDPKYTVIFTTPASNGIYVVGSILTSPSVTDPLTFMWNTVGNSSFDFFIRPQPSSTATVNVSFMVVFQ